MNAKLFKETITLINKCFPKNKTITEDEFLYFLLGYKENDSEHDDFLLTLEENLSNCLAGTENLRTTLGNRYNTIRFQTQNLQLKDLIKICPKIGSKEISGTEARLRSMQDELHKLYEKFSLPYSDSENSEQLFSKLFTACITEKTPRLFISQKKQQLKPATLNEILGRSDDSENLLKHLEQCHKVIIPGQHGSGKSRFIQYCLSTWGMSDYYYISYVNDLETAKKMISFYKDTKQGFTASFDDLTNNSYSSSLLVIDHMNEPDNVAEELAELASYAINVIVITTFEMTSSPFHIFRLSSLSDDTLMRIFENISGISLTNNEKELLFDVSQKNVLLISLIAGQYKQLTRQSADSPEIFSELLSVFDNTLGNHLPPALGRSLTFKNSYTQKTLDIFGHIKSIYADFAAKYDKQDPLRCTMRFLCCFGYSEIPTSFLQLFPGYNRKCIQEAIDILSGMGWLLKTNSTIQLPSLIARSVFAVEVPAAADCYNLINVMYDFLINFDQTLDMPYLSSTLYSFASSIYAKIKVKNNPNQKQASAEFEKWQDFIYSIYNYYLENGDFQLAEKITQIISYPNISHKHSELDPSFFQFSIHMSLQDWIEKIPEETDKLVAMIENSEALLYTQTTPFLITTMNNVIYLYCNCVFTYYNDIYTGDTEKWNIEELKSYRFTLFNTIGKILYDIPNPKYNKGTKISISQYEYYQLCHTLIKSPECISSHLFEPLIQEDNNTVSASESLISQLLTETNTNYRIRGIAFTMFMRSIYRKDLQLRLPASECSTDPGNLIFTIRCDINKLHEQITACEHIPWHTTWICLFCYLQLLAELSIVYKENSQHITVTYYTYILKFLLHRSTFSEKELKDVYKKIFADYISS